MKKETKLKHSKIANDMMYYIYKYLDTDINIDQLAIDFGISKFHFHRLFKEQMGVNIYESIKSIRLQKASTLLITNQESTITQIAKVCGYSSQTSFIRTFKERFSQTPKSWRKGGYKEYSNKILSTFPPTAISQVNFSCLEPKIVKTEAKIVYYIRGKGYNRKVIHTWQKLISWVYTHDIKEYEQIGIYHDNPIITPLDDCFHIAGIILKKDRKFKDTLLQRLELPAGIYAVFNVEGKYGDILKLIQWAYHDWLPNSGFETTPHPSYTIFEKNHYIEEDGLFKVRYYVPIRYV